MIPVISSDKIRAIIKPQTACLSRRFPEIVNARYKSPIIQIETNNIKIDVIIRLAKVEVSISRKFVRLSGSSVGIAKAMNAANKYGYLAKATVPAKSIHRMWEVESNRPVK